MRGRPHSQSLPTEDLFLDCLQVSEATRGRVESRRLAYSRVVRAWQVGKASPQGNRLNCMRWSGVPSNAWPLEPSLFPGAGISSQLGGKAHTAEAHGQCDLHGFECKTRTETGVAGGEASWKASKQRGRWAKRSKTSSAVFMLAQQDYQLIS